MTDSKELLELYQNFHNQQLNDIKAWNKDLAELIKSIKEDVEGIVLKQALIEKSIHDSPCTALKAVGKSISLDKGNIDRLQECIHHMNTDREDKRKDYEFILKKWHIWAGIIAGLVTLVSALAGLFTAIF